jgi:hypothetical protein
LAPIGNASAHRDYDLKGFYELYAGVYKHVGTFLREIDPAHSVVENFVRHPLRAFCEKNWYLSRKVAGGLKSS